MLFRSVLDGVINFVKGIFGKKDEKEGGDDESPALVKSLKPTVSIAVLEEKVMIGLFSFPIFPFYILSSSILIKNSLHHQPLQTAQFVKGKSDAKTYYGVLKAAFGEKLPSVLPQIIANLPAKKAADLEKVAR